MDQTEAIKSKISSNDKINIESFGIDYIKLHGRGGASLYIPFRASTSAKLRPKASTLINISSVFGVGLSTSFNANEVSVLPYFTRVMDLILVFLEVQLRSLLLLVFG